MSFPNFPMNFPNIYPNGYGFGNGNGNGNGQSNGNQNGRRKGKRGNKNWNQRTNGNGNQNGNGNNNKNNNQDKTALGYINPGKKYPNDYMSIFKKANAVLRPTRVPMCCYSSYYHQKSGLNVSIVVNHDGFTPKNPDNKEFVQTSNLNNANVIDAAFGAKKKESITAIVDKLLTIKKDDIAVSKLRSAPKETVVQENECDTDLTDNEHLKNYIDRANEDSKFKGQYDKSFELDSSFGNSDYAEPISYRQSVKAVKQGFSGKVIEISNTNGSCCATLFKHRDDSEVTGITLVFAVHCLKIIKSTFKKIALAYGYNKKCDKLTQERRNDFCVLSTLKAEHLKSETPHILANEEPCPEEVLYLAQPGGIIIPGVVIKVSTRGTYRVAFVDARVRSGCSSQPLLNPSGEIVGVLSAMGYGSDGQSVQIVYFDYYNSESSMAEYEIKRSSESKYDSFDLSSSEDDLDSDEEPEIRTFIETFKEMEIQNVPSGYSKEDTIRRTLDYFQRKKGILINANEIGAPNPQPAALGGLLFPLDNEKIIFDEPLIDVTHSSQVDKEIRYINIGTTKIDDQQWDQIIYPCSNIGIAGEIISYESQKEENVPAAYASYHHNVVSNYSLSRGKGNPILYYLVCFLCAFALINGQEIVTPNLEVRNDLLNLFFDTKNGLNNCYIHTVRPGSDLIMYSDKKFMYYKDKWETVSPGTDVGLNSIVSVCFGDQNLTFYYNYAPMELYRMPVFSPEIPDVPVQIPVNPDICIDEHYGAVDYISTDGYIINYQIPGKTVVNCIATVPTDDKPNLEYCRHGQKVNHCGLTLLCYPFSKIPVPETDIYCLQKPIFGDLIRNKHYFKGYSQNAFDNATELFKYDVSDIERALYFRRKTSYAYFWSLSTLSTQNLINYLNVDVPFVRFTFLGHKINVDQYLTDCQQDLLPNFNKIIYFQPNISGGYSCIKTNQLTGINYDELSKFTGLLLKGYDKVKVTDFNNTEFCAIDIVLGVKCDLIEKYDSDNVYLIFENSFNNEIEDYMIKLKPKPSYVDGLEMDHSIFIDDHQTGSDVHCQVYKTSTETYQGLKSVISHPRIIGKFNESYISVLDNKAIKVELSGNQTFTRPYNQVVCKKFRYPPVVFVPHKDSVYVTIDGRALGKSSGIPENFKTDFGKPTEIQFRGYHLNIQIGPYNKDFYQTQEPHSTRKCCNSETGLEYYISCISCGNNDLYITLLFFVYFAIFLIAFLIVFIPVCLICKLRAKTNLVQRSYFKGNKRNTISTTTLVLFCVLLFVTSIESSFIVKDTEYRGNTLKTQFTLVLGFNPTPGLPKTTIKLDPTYPDRHVKPREFIIESLWSKCSATTRKAVTLTQCKTTRTEGVHCCSHAGFTNEELLLTNKDCFNKIYEYGAGSSCVSSLFESYDGVSCFCASGDNECAAAYKTSIDTSKSFFPAFKTGEIQESFIRVKACIDKTCQEEDIHTYSDTTFQLDTIDGGLLVTIRPTGQVCGLITFTDLIQNPKNGGIYRIPFTNPDDTKAGTPGDCGVQKLITSMSQVKECSPENFYSPLTYATDIVHGNLHESTISSSGYQKIEKDMQSLHPINAKFTSSGITMYNQTGITTRVEAKGNLIFQLHSDPLKLVLPVIGKRNISCYACELYSSVVIYAVGNINSTASVECTPAICVSKVTPVYTTNFSTVVQFKPSVKNFKLTIELGNLKYNIGEISANDPPLIAVEHPTNDTIDYSKGGLLQFDPFSIPSSILGKSLFFLLWIGVGVIAFVVICLIIYCIFSRTNISVNAKFKNKFLMSNTAHQNESFTPADKP